MVDPEIAKALHEAGTGIKRLVNAVGKEMRRREGEPQSDDGDSEETFPLRVCQTNTVHYFTPQQIGSVESCPVCAGPLKKVRTVILS